MMRSLLVLVLLLALSARGAAQEAPLPPEAPSPQPSGPTPQASPEPPAAEEKKPVVVPPMLKEFVNADYPAEALALGLEAKVGLTVEIDAAGKVTKVEVKVPAGHGFDEAAVSAVQRFEFEPALVDGVPTPVRITYFYHFKLEKRSLKTVPGQTVSGTVKEKGVGLPVVGAEVALVEVSVKTTTDENGMFAFEGVLPGKYKAVITSPEYKPLTAELTVEEGKTLEAELLLEPVLENPYETVVEGKKEESVVTRYVLEQSAIETVPGTFGDPVRVIETLPGVARTPYGVGMLIIRGTAPGESKVYVNGVEVPLLYHFLAGPSIVNPNLLDRIDYYPGNFPSRYGEALGGIIDVKSKNERVEVWAGEADLNLLNASAYLEGPLSQDVSLRVGGRRSYVDLVLLAALSAAGESGTTVAPVYYDYQGNVDWDLDAHNRLGLFAFGSYDSLTLVTTDEDSQTDLDLSTATMMHRLVGSWRQAEGDFSFTLTPFVGWDEMTFDSAGATLDADLYYLYSRAEARDRLAPWVEVTAGLEGGVAWADFAGEMPVFNDYYIPGGQVIGAGEGDQMGESEPYTMENWYWVTAVYTDAAFRPWESLTLTPGIRAEVMHHPGATWVTWDPRLTARYEVVPSFAFKGGVGRFCQTPNPEFTEATYGNPDVDYQWAMHYSGGFEWQLTEDVGLDMVGFFVRKYDVVQRTMGETDEDYKPMRANNSGWGRSYGLETMLRYKPTRRFYGWVSYTLSRSEMAGTTGFHDDDPAGEEELSLSDWDQTHILSAVASVKLGRGWETGLRLRLVSGMPMTAVEGGIFIGDRNRYEALLGAAQAERFPTFFQLDFRVEKTWTFEAWLLSLYLDIQNVTDNANTEFLAYDYRFDKSWNVPGIPFFPSFGISGRF